MKRITRLMLIGLMAGLICGNTARADALAIRSINGQGASQEAAMQNAAQAAFKQAVAELRLEATEAQMGRVLTAYPEYFTRTIIKLEKTETSITVVVDYLVDGDGLRSVLMKREVAKISEQLGHPQIAFALIPRAPEGQKLPPGTKSYFTEQLNTALQEAFVDAGFKAVYPDWLLKEMGDFSGDPAHDVALQRNLMMRAKMDSGTHYLVTGAATMDVLNAGGETEVHLAMNGVVVNTFTENSLSVPFQYTGAFKGVTERVAIAQACSIVAERAAKQKALPRLVSDWNEQSEKGTIYTLSVFFDSSEFKSQMLAGLESAGAILDVSSLAPDLLRVRYQTRSVQRKDFGDSYLLGRRFKSAPVKAAFFCAANQSEFVIGPDKSAYKKAAQAIVNGQRYTLVDPKTLPPGLQERKVSEQPVHEDSDTALAMVARKYAEAVGLVVCIDADKKVWTATAWAFGPKQFASNGHVSQPAAKALRNGGQVFIYLNRKGGERLRVKAAYTHPRYTERESRSPSYDVGVLEVEGQVADYLPIAKEPMLRAVDSGTKVAFLGFPSEGLEHGNFNVTAPIATMQSGIITSVSDYELGDSGFSGNVLYRHSLPATGGASGSPIFNPQGAVIGILNAGNVYMGRIVPTRNEQTGEKGMDVERAPSAALVNFAQRVDLLWDIVPKGR